MVSYGSSGFFGLIGLPEIYEDFCSHFRHFENRACFRFSAGISFRICSAALTHMSQEIPVTRTKRQVNLKDACWNTGNVWIKHVSKHEKPVSSKYNHPICWCFRYLLLWWIGPAKSPRSCCIPSWTVSILDPWESLGSIYSVDCFCSVIWCNFRAMTRAGFFYKDLPIHPTTRRLRTLALAQRHISKKHLPQGLDFKRSWAANM